MAERAIGTILGHIRREGLRGQWSELISHVEATYNNSLSLGDRILTKRSHERGAPRHDSAHRRRNKKNSRSGPSAIRELALQTKSKARAIHPVEARLEKR